MSSLKDKIYGVKVEKVEARAEKVEVKKKK